MIERNEREDERLNLSRRSFFFFGAILAAKPEIVVPKTAAWPSGTGDDDFRHAIWLPPEITLATYYLPTKLQIELIRSGKTVRVSSGQFRLPLSRRPT